MSVRRSYEPKRGCGFRKQGGLYLVSDGGGEPCGRFPIEVSVCPLCGQGIKPSRSFTWVDGELVKRMAPDCSWELGVECSRCAMHPDCKVGKAGLIWVGEKYYPTPQDFLVEAAQMGISRRISALPKGLVDAPTGEITAWIFLAHRRAIPVVDDVAEEVIWQPGIFCIWRPRRVEKVVTPEITEEEEAKLRKRGIEPVIVEPMQQALFEDGEIAGVE